MQKEYNMERVRWIWEAHVMMLKFDEQCITIKSTLSRRSQAGVHHLTDRPARQWIKPALRMASIKAFLYGRCNARRP